MPSRLSAGSRIVVATGNEHKLEEIRAIFAVADLPFELVSLAGLGRDDLEEPVEDAETFEGNARLKAISYATQTGEVCLADDSGLEVDVLDGRPGVNSARYCATPGGTVTSTEFAAMGRPQRDAANNARLLSELQGVPLQQRTARFVCAMSLAIPEGPEPAILHCCRGTFEGRIGIPPRVPSGDNGFGYDPLFLVEGMTDTTSAELEPSRKNGISHRANAATRMADYLTT